MDTELYEHICKESRKRKGSSASGPSAAKRSKSVPPEENKDLKNQLEKASLEGVREGLEKREASLSSSQGSLEGAMKVSNLLAVARFRTGYPL